MKRFRTLLNLSIVTALCTCAFAAYSSSASPATDVVPTSQGFQKAVSIFGEPELIKLTDRVYLAFSYDISNCVFVIGEDGVVVIDTLYAVENSEKAYASLREITDKPIVAVIYSHGHFDHTGGVRAFVPEGRENAIAIYASEVWPRYRQELASPLYPMIGRRFLEQTGLAVLPLGSSRQEHVLGPINPSARTLSYVNPNRTISGVERVTLAGVEFVIASAPSEMDDELVVWIPEEGVAYGADTMASLYPFLATPRSEPSRSIPGLIAAMDILLDWEPEHLVLGHGPSMSGVANVKKFLTNFRDAEQTLVDQTIAAINAGKTRDVTAAEVTLPAHLANDPLLEDSYHRASWVHKGLYTDLSGWFGNDALEMIQHAPVDEAARMIRLAGGAKKMLKQAKAALKEGDSPWAAQLATYLMTAGERKDEATTIKIAAFKAVAAQTHSSNERYYMLAGALWLEQGETLVAPFMAKGNVDMVPSSVFVEFLGPKLDRVRSAELLLKINLELTDSNEQFRLTVRRGVLARRGGRHDQPNLTLTMDREALVDFAAGLVSAQSLLETKRIRSDGDAMQFMSLFY